MAADRVCLFLIVSYCCLGVFYFVGNIFHGRERGISIGRPTKTSRYNRQGWHGNASSFEKEQGGPVGMRTLRGRTVKAEHQKRKMNKNSGCE